MPVEVNMGGVWEKTAGRNWREEKEEETYIILSQFKTFRGKGRKKKKLHMAENQCKGTCEAGQGWSLTTWDFCHSDFDSIHLPGGAVQKHHSWYLLTSNTCLSLTKRTTQGTPMPTYAEGDRKWVSRPLWCYVCSRRRGGKNREGRVSLWSPFTDCTVRMRDLSSFLGKY